MTHFITDSWPEMFGHVVLTNSSQWHELWLIPWRQLWQKLLGPEMAEELKSRQPHRKGRTLTRVWTFRRPCWRERSYCLIRVRVFWNVLCCAWTLPCSKTAAVTALAVAALPNMIPPHNPLRLWSQMHSTRAERSTQEITRHHNITNRLLLNHY